MRPRYPASGQRGGPESGRLWAEPVLATPTVTAASPCLPGPPVQPAPGGQGPPLTPPPGTSAVIEPGGIFHAEADVPVVGAVNTFAPCFLLCIDAFTVNEITVWGTR